VGAGLRPSEPRFRAASATFGRRQSLDGAQEDDGPDSEAEAHRSPMLITISTSWPGGEGESAGELSPARTADEAELAVPGILAVVQEGQ